MPALSHANVLLRKALANGLVVVNGAKTFQVHTAVCILVGIRKQVPPATRVHCQKGGSRGAKHPFG